MAKDFLTKQARTGKIIGNNNSNSGNHPKLIVYSDSNAKNSSGVDSNTGELSSDLANRLANVGADAFIYIDGIPGSKKAGTSDTVAVFGGDVVVSGSLYAKGNESSLWELVDANDANSDLMPTNTIDGDTGLFAMNFEPETDSDGVTEYSRYTTTLKNCSSDLYFEYDGSNLDTIIPKA